MGTKHISARNVVPLTHQGVKYGPKAVWWSVIPFGSFMQNFNEIHNGIQEILRKVTKNAKNCQINLAPLTHQGAKYGPKAVWWSVIPFGSFMQNFNEIRNGVQEILRKVTKNVKNCQINLAPLTHQGVEYGPKGVWWSVIPFGSFMQNFNEIHNGVQKILRKIIKNAKNCQI